MKNTSIKMSMNPGEAIYIPEGYWHCVKSLTP